MCCCLKSSQISFFTCATTTPTRQILWKNLCRATRTRTQTDEVGAHSAAITLSLCRGFLCLINWLVHRATISERLGKSQLFCQLNYRPELVEKCGFDPLPEGRVLQTRCWSHQLSFSVVFCEGDHGNAPCYPGSKPGILLLDSSPIILFAPQAGLEPARPEENALTVRRSTNYAYCGAKKTRNHKNIRYPVIVSHVSDFPMNILVIIWSRVSGSNRCELFASGLEDRCSTNWANPAKWIVEDSNFSFPD